MIHEYEQFETDIYHRRTDLESLHGSIGGTTIDMSSVRSGDCDTPWVDVRRDMVDYLSRHVGDATYVGKGRRYIAYRVGDVLVKFLYINKANNIYDGGTRIRKTNSRSTIFRVHNTEHANVRQYFTDMVPDTLFISTRFPVEGLNGCSEIDRVDGAHAFFMVQECVFDAVSIHTAMLGDRAEKPVFRDHLERFLTDYQRMRSDLGLLPELPSLRGQNVLVATNGMVWVVDTNNLVRTNTHEGEFVLRYRNRWKVADDDHNSDAIMRQIEDNIRALESGYVPGNPQG